MSYMETWSDLDAEIDAEDSDSDYAVGQRQRVTTLTTQPRPFTGSEARCTTCGRASHSPRDFNLADGHVFTTHRIRCGSCLGTHLCAADVKACYAVAAAQAADYEAEMAWEAHCEKAYALDRERISENGTWWGQDAPGEY